MKKVLLALCATALLAACGGNSNSPATENEDTTTYEQVKQKIDSTVAQNAPVIEQEEWQDGGEIVWDD